jgi:hypothetical protein
MKRSRATIGIGIVAMLLFALVLSIAPAITQAQAEEEERFSLEPINGTVEAGQVVEFIGLGFGNVEQVRTWATNPYGQVYTGETAIAYGADGLVFFSYRVPEDGVAGQWAMTARGDDANVDVITHFEVVSATPSPLPGALPPEAVRSIEPVVPVVEAGGILDFVATGFTNEEGIEGWATDPLGVSFGGSFTYADSTGGRALLTFYVPLEAINGYWTMSARGEESQEIVTASFQVTEGLAPADAPSRLEISPSVGTPGTAFTITGRNFDAMETVSYTINGPEGMRYHKLYGPETDRNGVVEFTWVAPAGSPAGQWSVSLQGLRSWYVLGKGFTIE